MKSRFNYRKYSEDNPDLAEHFGGVNEAQLKNHYDQYGYREMRGVPETTIFVTVEGLLCSDDGHIYISGWCDRRVFSTLDVTIRVGYMQYEFGEIEPCWYHRDDVSAVLGDFSRPSGYIAILKVPKEDFLVAPEVEVFICRQKIRAEPVMRFMSVDRFLNEALAATATLADRPAGTTVEHARKLTPAFDGIWKDYLASLSFTQIFESRRIETCKQSIIITLYRGFDMLLVQLAELSGFLSSHEAEVIVVGNDLTAPEEMLARVTAFCQLHDVAIRIFLCSGNSGFSAGNNFGAEMARGETLIFMNPDIFPPEGDEAQALDFLSSDPGTALHGAMLYYGDGMLMHSGMYSVRDLVFDPKSGVTHNLLRVEHFGKGLSHRVDDSQQKLDAALVSIKDDILLVSAALWKVSKAKFEEIGGLSTEYIFAYYEDSDFCLRWRSAGNEVKLDSSSRWIHMEGVGKALPPSVRTFMWLNRALYSQKFEASPLVVDTSEDLKLL
ncbi:glycosyltransferase family 2 protein [Mesobacterium pallidum]|uniref:glycosyltransferase family 2 protein n=1 Tax=Mesobacterium pallidum TaxID=2872037 RepID=UPI001EE2BA90|nr:glycosyltransferase [Mesobacterium pallidum]